MASELAQDDPAKGNVQGTVWAKRRNSNGPSMEGDPSPGGASTKIQIDHLTCTSIDSHDNSQVKDQVMSEAPKMAAPAGMRKNSIGVSSDSDSVKNKDEVNIDFSNINDIQSTPSAKSTSGILEKKGGPSPVGNFRSANFVRLEHPADKSLMLSFLASLFFLIASLVLFGPAIAIVCVLLPLGWLVKKCLACCCCAKNSSCSVCCSSLLSHNEAYWLHDTSLNRLIVQSLVTLEHGLDITHVQDLINSRLVSAESKSGKKVYPVFTQKIVPLKAGYAWRTDHDFCINRHIFSMPTTISTELQLQSYVSNMANKPLSLEHPLWEVHVLTNYGPEKDTVLLIRIHPCVSDGIALVRIFTKSVIDNQMMCDLKPRYGQTAMVFNIIRAIVVAPIVLVHKCIFTRKDYNPIHGPPLSGKKIVAWSESYSLGKAMRIKQVTRSTLNDVFLSVAAGNLRTYLKVQGVSNAFDMLSNIPVDLRSDGASITMGNRYSLVDLTLPTNTEGAIPRLWEIKHRMDELKNSSDHVVMYGLIWGLMWMFPECIYKRIFSAMTNNSSCVISNLQGPEVALTFGSRQVKGMMYWMPPKEEIALSISFFTYADQVCMSVVADEGVVPNPEVITQDFVQQVITYSS